MTSDRGVSNGHMPFAGGTTYYRIVGNLDGSATPLLVVHGGPGMTWDYLEELDALSSCRPVVYYDQFGNGLSRPVGSEAAARISLGLLVDQLHDLIMHLGLSDDYAVLGHSSGNAIVLEHALTKPGGLKALVLANAFASTDLMRQSIQSLRNELPIETRETLARHELAGTTNADDYTAAVALFMTQHVCRISPFPDGLNRALSALNASPDVFAKLWGPSLFTATGAYAGWSAVDRLRMIDVPTFAFRGQFDEADGACMAPLIDTIPNIEWMVFGGTSHMPHAEDTDACVTAIETFLTRYCMTDRSPTSFA